MSKFEDLGFEDSLEMKAHKFRKYVKATTNVSIEDLGEEITILVQKNIDKTGFGELYIKSKVQELGDSVAFYCFRTDPYPVCEHHKEEIKGGKKYKYKKKTCGIAIGRMDLYRMSMDCLVKEITRSIRRYLDKHDGLPPLETKTECAICDNLMEKLIE